MTKDEFKKITAALKAVYTSQSFLPDTYALSTWYGLLADIDYEDAKRAAQRHMMTNKFPPTPADIRALATENRLGVVEDWGLAWGKVLKAVKNFGVYREHEALETLDEITRKAVESMDYKSICNSENIEIDRAQFRQIYTGIVYQRKQNDVLPEKLKLETRTQKMLKDNSVLALTKEEE